MTGSPTVAALRELEEQGYDLRLDAETNRWIVKRGNKILATGNTILEAYDALERKMRTLSHGRSGV